MKILLTFVLLSLSISLDKQVILQKNNIDLYKHYVDIILVYTVNDYCEYKYLIENGVDGVFEFPSNYRVNRVNMFITDSLISPTILLNQTL